MYLAVCVVCILLICLFTAISTIVHADEWELELVEPTPPPQMEVLLAMSAPPEQANSCLMTYETFEEAFARNLAAVPDEDAAVGGRLIWGEAGNVRDTANRYATLWTAINRVKAWGNSLLYEMQRENAFHGLNRIGETPAQFIGEAKEIIALWYMEQEGWIMPEGLVPALPERFLYFSANEYGTANVFTTEYGGGEVWDGVESRWE